MPAAGQGRRLGRLPLSKELWPLGLREAGAAVPTEGGAAQTEGSAAGARVASHEMLDAYRAAGIERAYLVLRREKMDIPAYLGRDGGRGVALAYVVIEESASVPESLDAAWPFVQDAVVVLGFPDVLFTPRDAYARLLDRYRRTGADLVLGLFPTPLERRSSTDMVRLGAEGRVTEIEVRPAVSQLEYNWLIAVWGPRFTTLLHEHVAAGRQSAEPRSGPQPAEPHLGDVFQRALGSLQVVGVSFAEGSFRDLGTPEELEKQMKFFSAPSR